MKTMNTKHKFAIVAALALSTATIVRAQNVKQLDEPYVPAGQSATINQDAEMPIAPAPRAPGVPRAVVFQIAKNQPIHEALKAWAANSDWEFTWFPSVSWKAVRSTNISAVDVVAAISDVVDTLRYEGKPIALRISDGNKFMEVISTEVRND